MTTKPKRDSRHITLSKEALTVYDSWKEKGEANKTSQAIIEFDNKVTETFTVEQEQRIQEIVDLAITKWNGK